MELNFSDKYQPLFDLLEAWNVTKSERFKEEYNEQEQSYWLSLSKVDTVLMSGGRDSGKSFALSCFNPIAARDYGHRILYTRQTMSSTDNSITEALENRIEMLGYDVDFSVANKAYEVIDGNGKIVITGQKTSTGTQTAKLKSLEDFSIFETDEGEELESYDSWKKVKRSMRASDVQCLSIIVFNPPTIDHWLYEKFYQSVPDGFNGVRDNVLYIHTTYLDNGQENMASHNWQEYESLRKDYELYESTGIKDRESLPFIVKRNHSEYKHTILGGFKSVAEGAIFTNWKLGEFKEGLPTTFGQDYGFSNDPTTLVKVGIDKKERTIYVQECFGKVGLSTSEIAELNKQYAGNSLIVGDSSEPRLIKELQTKGCNLRQAQKGQGSVTSGISLLQDYLIIVDGENIAKELNNYVWHDKKSKVPVDAYNHYIDAIRYACENRLNVEVKPYFGR